MAAKERQGKRGHFPRRSRWKFVIIAVCVIAFAVLGLYLHFRTQDAQPVEVGNEVDVGLGYREIVYEGKKYRYNERITTIVYAGVDADGSLTVSSKYANAPLADSISVIVLDEYHHRMSIIALSRDTMTGIHKYTLDGKDRGVFTDHLGFAYAYGEGGRVSGMNLCEAISDLLCNVPVRSYVVTSRASIPVIADIIGPVEVTVPNNDIADEGFVEGETVVIDGSNLETFIRSRDTGKDLSNVGRMERQRAYIEAVAGKLTDYLTANSSEAWDKIMQAEKIANTSITRSSYLNLTKKLKNLQFGNSNYYTLEGQNVVGPKYDEFYPDLSQVKKLVVDLFYIEQ
ncbi:MAG: LCP family protein [Clostridia bacterium]|nr:LCP family protein [Clostridia bacterium]